MGFGGGILKNSIRLPFSMIDRTHLSVVIRCHSGRKSFFNIYFYLSKNRIGNTKGEREWKEKERVREDKTTQNTQSSNQVILQKQIHFQLFVCV